MRRVLGFTTFWLVTTAAAFAAPPAGYYDAVDHSSAEALASSWRDHIFRISMANLCAGGALFIGMVSANLFY